jgi:hypothetical protein
LQIIGVLVGLLRNNLITPIITMQWLSVSSWVNRETDGVHDLRLACGEGFLMA